MALSDTMNDQWKGYMNYFLGLPEGHRKALHQAEKGMQAMHDAKLYPQTGGKPPKPQKTNGAQGAPVRAQTGGYTMPQAGIGNPTVQLDPGEMVIPSGGVNALQQAINPGVNPMIAKAVLSSLLNSLAQRPLLPGMQAQFGGMAAGYIGPGMRETLKNLLGPSATTTMLPSSFRSPIGFTDRTNPERSISSNTGTVERLISPSLTELLKRGTGWLPGGPIGGPMGPMAGPKMDMLTRFLEHPEFLRRLARFKSAGSLGGLL